MDWTSLVRFIHEAEHHFELNLTPDYVEVPESNGGSRKLCRNQGSFLHWQHASMDKQSWNPGRINETHTSAHGVIAEELDDLSLEELKNKCPTHPYEFAHERQSRGFGFDVVTLLNKRMLSNCVRRLDQALDRWLLPRQSEAGGREKRGFLGFLGPLFDVGNLALGIANWKRNSVLQEDQRRLEVSVQGLVGESHHLSRAVGALIDAEARTNANVQRAQQDLVRVTSLSILTAISNSACEISNTLRQGLREVGRKRFPISLFSKKQLDEFARTFKKKVKPAGLQPILSEASMFMDVQAEGAIFSRQEYIPPESADNLPEYQKAIRTQSVFLTKDWPKHSYTWHARLDDAEAGIEDWVHRDHQLEDTDLLKKPGQGLSFEVVVSVPLRLLGEDGYQAYQVRPSLFTMHHNASNPNDYPVVVRPDFEGALFMRQGLANPQEDTMMEVSSAYFRSCTAINPVTRICPRPVRRAEMECLKSLFQGHSLRTDCLAHFQVVPTSEPVLGDVSQDHVTIFLPPDFRLFAKCGERRERVKLLQSKPGLYSVTLPTGCALTAGPLTWTMLSSVSVFSPVDVVEDAEVLQKLIHMSGLMEKEGWKQWREYRLESETVNKNLQQLKKRLEENPVQRFLRSNPTFLGWANIAGAVVILVLIGLGVLATMKWYNHKKARYQQAFRYRESRRRDREAGGVELQPLQGNLEPLYIPRALEDPAPRRFLAVV